MSGRPPLAKLDVRVGPRLRVAISAIGRVAIERNLTWTDYFTMVVSRFVAKLMCGDADVLQIEDPPLNQRWHIRLPTDLVDKLNELAATNNCATVDLIRTALVFEEHMRERLALENLYRTEGLPGDPSTMSDAFLFLWKRHHYPRGFGASPQYPDATPQAAYEAQVLAALRTLEIKCTRLEEDLRKALGLLKYAETGVRMSRHPPTQAEIEAMPLATLHALAETWGFNIPAKAKIAAALRLARGHFGYVAKE